MTFTKQELEQELRTFMTGFAQSVERIYGTRTGGALLGHSGTSAHFVEPENAHLETAALWRAVTTMYDYGISAVAHPSFGSDGDVGNHYGEAEMFLLGLSSLEPFLEEDNVRSPWLSKLTVRTALARHVLDGGDRYMSREDDELSGYLSIPEVALLANMDERSVRNAANPKLPDALATESLGKRTMVNVSEARRWLAGRKGFTPTHPAASETKPAVEKLANVALPSQLAHRLEAEAGQAGISAWEYLQRLLDEKPISAS